MNRGIDLNCNFIDNLSIPNDRNRGTVYSSTFQSYSIPLFQRVEIEGLLICMHVSNMHSFTYNVKIFVKENICRNDILFDINLNIFFLHLIRFDSYNNYTWHGLDDYSSLNTCKWVRHNNILQYSTNNLPMTTSYNRQGKAAKTPNWYSQFGWRKWLGWRRQQTRQQKRQKGTRLYACRRCCVVYE